MKRCVIIGGAEIRNYEMVRRYFQRGDTFIFCDCGLKHKNQLGVTPDLIVGDFDSYPKPDSEEAETIVLPREKDDTDTVYAVKEAIKRGFTDYLLAGVIGERFDHTLGNLSLLLMLNSKNLNAKIIDDYSEMEIISENTACIDDSCSYFSLLAVGGDCKGVTIRNAKYELDHAEISCEYQYGISNEPMPGKTAEVSLENGRLLLIKIVKQIPTQA